MESTPLLWQNAGWPSLRYDGARVSAEVALARRAQGNAEGKLTALGFEQRQELAAEAFEDGNGRVGRVIVDLVLARDSGEASRLIRISQRLLERRAEYYDELESAQHGPLDVTPWVVWFVAQVRAACEQASVVIDLSLQKARFWLAHRDKELSLRQRKVLNALLDAGPGGFAGGMSTKKYENLTGASRATSSRDLIELESLGLLRHAGSGRSTRYRLDIDGWDTQVEDA